MVTNARLFGICCHFLDCFFCRLLGCKVCFRKYSHRSAVHSVSGSLRGTGTTLPYEPEMRRDMHIRQACGSSLNLSKFSVRDATTVISLRQNSHTWLWGNLCLRMRSLSSGALCSLYKLSIWTAKMNCSHGLVTGSLKTSSNAIHPLKGL